jgi:cytochrome P450
MRRDLIGFCAGLNRRYGDVVGWRLGPVAFYQLTHPDQIHDVLVLKARNFRKPERLRQVFGRFQGSGLFLSEGQDWVKQRQRLQPAFQPSRMRSLATTITQCAVDTFNRWGGHAEVDFQEEMKQVAFGVARRALFSSCSDEAAERLGAAAAVIQKWSIRELTAFFTMPRWLPLWGDQETRRAINVVRSLMWPIIAERGSAARSHDDMLDHLVATGDTESDRNRLDKRQIQDELVTLLFAGYETSGIAMTWAGLLLATHPDTQERLSEEVRGALGGRIPDLDDLPRLRGVEMAFKEAMRLFPPVYFFSREVVKTVEVAGCTMRPGAQVFLSPFLTHRDPRWFPNPTVFDPWRFSAENERNLPACAWFPFGAGPRACIGRGFALLEGTLVLAILLQRYRLEPAPGQSEPSPECQFTLHPKGGVRLCATLRDG